MALQPYAIIYDSDEGKKIFRYFLFILLSEIRFLLDQSDSILSGSE